MLGKYRLKSDGVFRCGITTFGLSAGSIVEVTQLDKEGRKVLIDFGGRMVDWYSDRMLDRFEAV
jgi:hypothetical protein